MTTDNGRAEGIAEPSPTLTPSLELKPHSDGDLILRGDAFAAVQGALERAYLDQFEHAPAVRSALHIDIADIPPARPTPSSDVEQEARELLANLAYRDGCREKTQDEILYAAPGILPMLRVKASVAIEAIEHVRALSNPPAIGDEVREALGRCDPGFLRRLDAGQKFNAYEVATGDTWSVGLGPVTDFLGIWTCRSPDAADMLVDILRLSVGQPHLSPSSQQDGGE